MKGARSFIVAVGLLGVLVVLNAQVSNQGIFRTGPPPVVGNCVKWSGINSIADAGAPCGSGGGSPSDPVPLIF